MPSGDGKFASNQESPGFYGDDHAVRLRVLEGGYADLNAQLAANTVQLEGLNDGVSRLAGHIDDLHKVITTSIPTLAKDVDSLKSVEATRAAKREKRRSFISRYASGAMVALSAASVTKLAPLLWTYLHR